MLILYLLLQDSSVVIVCDDHFKPVNGTYGIQGQEFVWASVCQNKGINVKWMGHIES